MKEFTLTVASPDGELYRGEVLSVSLRGSEGDLAIMAGHIPFVTSIKAGKIKIELEDEDKFAETDGGILNVTDKGAIILSGSFHFTEE